MKASKVPFSEGLPEREEHGKTRCRDMAIAKALFNWQTVMK